MSTIPHLFGEKISRVGGALDVGDGEGRILDPFPNRVLTLFKMTGLLGSHVVTPLDTGFIIVALISSNRVRDGIAVHGQPIGEATRFSPDHKAAWRLFDGVVDQGRGEAKPEDMVSFNRLFRLKFIRLNLKNK